VRRGLAPANSFHNSDGLLELYEKRLGSYADYSEELVRAIENGLFTGLRVDEVRSIASEIASRERDRTYVFTRELLRAVQGVGYCTVAISGSMHEVAKPFATSWGFEHVFGSEMSSNEHGLYYGTPDQRVVYARNKGEVVRGLVEREHLLMRDSIAVGDTLSDASMLEAVDYPILFNPDQKLLEYFEQQTRSWWLVVERRLVYCYGMGLPDDVEEALRDALSKAGAYVKYL
jgi:HAD superfamily phosphoserine phosphatase-like hydrolase